MPIPTSLSPPRPPSTSRLSPLAPAPDKLSPVPFAGPSNSFEYRRFSASRLSDTRGSLDRAEDELTPNRSLNGDKKDDGRGLGSLVPFGNGRWAQRYGPGWRVGFGSSNERGGGDDDAIDEDSPEPKDVLAVAAPSSSRHGSEDLKEEFDWVNAGHSKGSDGMEVETGDVKPKRKPRKSAPRKGKDGGEDAPPPAKRRKGTFTSFSTPTNP